VLIGGLGGLGGFGGTGIQWNPPPVSYAVAAPVTTINQTEVLSHSLLLLGQCCTMLIDAGSLG
jgi:hypothetical protein